MTIDKKGFRIGIAVILVNKENRVFWAKRIGQNAWQFPQGGVLEKESSEEAMLRELHEETGLDPEDVKIIASSKNWLYYHLPINMIRHDLHPLCIGQR
jgi:putative (di)nucleoside polyphosphate hydrolase